MSDYYYVGRLACGCIVAATHDAPARTRETAKEIAYWIREGYAVNRVPVETVRAETWHRSSKPCPKARLTPEPAS